MKNLGYRATTYEVYYEYILLKYPKAGNIQSVFLAKKGKKMKNTIEQMELKNVRELVTHTKYVQRIFLFVYFSSWIFAEIPQKCLKLDKAWQCIQSNGLCN